MDVDIHAYSEESSNEKVLVNMKTHLAKITLAILSIACCANANASLQSKDLTTVGDGLLTLDTTTGLSWLDLSVTAGLSPLQVLSGAGGWTTRGFRYATRQEVLTLFSDAGLSNSKTWSYSEYVPAWDFASHFGRVYDGWYGRSSVALGRIISPNLLQQDLIQVVSDYSNGGGNSGIWQDTYSLGDSVNGNYGSFLVFAPVPEPGSYVMLLAGFGLMGLSFRSRKQWAR